MASLTSPGRPRLSAVRAVSRVRKLASLIGENLTSGVSPPETATGTKPSGGVLRRNGGIISARLFDSVPANDQEEQCPETLP